MNEQSATKDFYRARKRANIERLQAWLLRRSAGLLCYWQVRDRLSPKAGRHVGIENIPLDAIAGSVDRCGDYTRSFLPLKDSDRPRWTRVMEAVQAAVALSPIRVYLVGDDYFVIDGHHRVSVARQRGMTHIDAQVTEVKV